MNLKNSIIYFRAILNSSRLLMVSFSFSFFVIASIILYFIFPIKGNSLEWEIFSASITGTIFGFILFEINKKKNELKRKYFKNK